MLQKLTHTQQRLIVGGFSALFVAFMIYMAPYPYFRPLFGLITGGVIASAVWEYYNIARTNGHEPLDKTGIAITVVYVFAVFLSTQFPTLHALPELILLLGLLIFFTHYFVNGPNPFVNLAISAFALAYLAIPLATILSIVYSSPEGQDGRWWLAYLLTVTKMTDVGAFFFGKQFGKHKLAPYISPGKTWEGAIGGFLTAIVSSLFLYLFLHHFYEAPPINISLALCLILAGILSVVAQFGDLAESLLKRDVGVKDSNPLVPGLGGMLDLVDSLVFTAPLLYIYLRNL